jgi:hypothetical protein
MQAAGKLAISPGDWYQKAAEGLIAPAKCIPLMVH